MKSLYKVVYTGKLQKEANPSIVIQKFSLLFKIPNSKAQQFLSSSNPKAIKKDLSHEIALKYKNKLEKIGLQIEICEARIEKKKHSATCSENNTLYIKEKTKQKSSNPPHNKPEIRDNKSNLAQSPSEQIDAKTPSQQMSLLGLFLRFSIVYLLLNIAISIVLNLLAIKSNSGAVVATLFGATMYACLVFGKKNNRFFTKKEKTSAVLGFAFINILMQLLFTLLLLTALSKPLSSTILLFTLGITIIVHTPIIYFFIGRTKKTLIRQGIITD